MGFPFHLFICWGKVLALPLVDVRNAPKWKIALATYSENTLWMNIKLYCWSVCQVPYVPCGRKKIEAWSIFNRRLIERCCNSEWPGYIGGESYGDDSANIEEDNSVLEFYSKRIWVQEEKSVASIIPLWVNIWDTMYRSNLHTQGRAYLQ